MRVEVNATTTHGVKVSASHYYSNEELEDRFSTRDITKEELHVMFTGVISKAFQNGGNGYILVGDTVFSIKEFCAITVNVT